MMDEEERRAHMECEMREAVIQNLKDAGCNQVMIEQFLGYVKEGQTDEQLRLLIGQRKTLLERVHVEERKIDCLDYLVYQIRKNAVGADSRE